MELQSSKKSRQFTCLADCSEKLSLVSVLSVIKAMVASLYEPSSFIICAHMLHTECYDLFSVFTKMRVPCKVSQADPETVARRYEKHWWEVWDQCSHLFCVPEVASHV